MVKKKSKDKKNSNLEHHIQEKQITFSELSVKL